MYSVGCLPVNSASAHSNNILPFAFLHANCQNGYQVMGTYGETLQIYCSDISYNLLSWIYEIVCIYRYIYICIHVLYHYISTIFIYILPKRPPPPKLPKNWTSLYPQNVVPCESPPEASTRFDQIACAYQATWRWWDGWWWLVVGGWWLVVDELCLIWWCIIIIYIRWMDGIYVQLSL